jgi:hypothetical protein
MIRPEKVILYVEVGRERTYGMTFYDGFTHIAAIVDVPYHAKAL